VCSPPLGAIEDTGAPTWGDGQVYRACVGNSPGTMTQLTDFDDGGATIQQCSNPVISPDGSKVLFQALSATTGFYEIWMVASSPLSTAVQLIADGSNHVIHPSWAPDSDTFVYVHCAGGAIVNGTIYKDTVSAIGSPVSLKAAAGATSPWRPQFNFDGTRVAYIFDKNVLSGADLRVMDADGTNDASLDNNIFGLNTDKPPQLSWANAVNKIAYTDGFSGSNGGYVINDDGTGKTQINANGVAAGANCAISGRAWPADDSFVVFGSNLGNGYFDVIHAELDGSNTTSLSSTSGHGATTQTRMMMPLVYQNRIWFIEKGSALAAGWVSSFAMDGSDYVNHFDSEAGAGDVIGPFGGGDGWYFT
jgi:Tol biopolymer transport system component